MTDQRPMEDRLAAELTGDMENFLERLWDAAAAWAQSRGLGVTHQQYIAALEKLGIADDVAWNWTGERADEKLDADSLAKPITWYEPNPDPR